MADSAWNITKGDTSVKIAIMDTWFDINHPDLANQLVCTYDPYDLQPFYTDGTKSGHGTAVASFAAAETDGGGQLASIGFRCRIIPYKAWSGHYLERAHHASLAMHADILTSSAGGWNCDRNFNDIERIAVKEILDNGTVIVMPAGNGNQGSHCYSPELESDQPWRPLHPYYDNRIIIVSSTDINDNHHNGTDSSHSHYAEVDICAPGYTVMGAKNTVDENGNPFIWPYFGEYAGTSFSTPIVAGTCALIKSINKCLTPYDIQEIIKQTADPIHDANLYPGLVGAGRINAYRAVSLAQTYHNSNDTITSNALWSENSYQGGNMVVDSNATLTVTGVIHFGPDARLIVRPGGKLVVDGGTLTSACPGELWQGIEVVGDRTKRQLAQWQGTVELKNGAVIENAHCGIYTGLGNDNWHTTGGIIKADSAFFINNQRAVAFLSYQNTRPNGSIADNASYFTDCEFVVDDNNLFAQNNCSFIDHVTMWQVRGVKFKGCRFLNATSSSGNRHHAIYTDDAGFEVKTYCRSQNLIGCECPENKSVYCEFSGFSTAIEVNTTGDQHAVMVDQANFRNNVTGVKIDGNHFVTVTRNDFDLQCGFSSSKTTGLYLNNCSGYQVEENRFHRASGDYNYSSTGIRVYNSGVSDNSIYRNVFDTLDYGISVSGTNGDATGGLQILCGDFSGNGTDICLATSSTIVSPLQGSLQSSAGNTFSGTRDYNIKNLSNQTIFYFYTGTPSSSNPYYPSLRTSNVLPYQSNTANPCISTLCNNGGTPKSLAEFQSDMDANTGSTQPLSDTYHAAVRTLMSDTVLDLNELEMWHTAAQPIADPYSLTETRFMEGYAETFAEDAEDAEMANYAEFHALKLALRGDNADNDNNDNADNQDNNDLQNSPKINWYALTSAQITQLQTIAERNTGRASVMAKGVLCFFHGICYEDDLLGDDNMDNHDNNMETRSAKVSQLDGETNLTVYPNPTDDVLFIKLRGGAGIANIALYDLQGRIVTGVFDTPQQGGTATITVKSIPAGVYVLRVTDADGHEYHQKIVRK